METANISKREAIEIATKVLKDIEEWDSYAISKAVYVADDPSSYGYEYWIVSFNYTSQDWYNGTITPYVIVNDQTEIATYVLWKKSSALLRYDKGSDKYSVY